MATWPNASQDYDTKFLNNFHGPLTKTQKFNVYKIAFELACKELGITCQVDYRRIKFMEDAVNLVKQGRTE